MLIRIRGRVAAHASIRGPFAETEEYPEGVERPKTRAECENGERPCPFVSCRHNLFLDVMDNGNIQTRADDVEDLIETCALDVADRGPSTLEEVCVIIDRSREMVRQIEAGALMRIRRFKGEPISGVPGRAAL